MKKNYPAWVEAHHTKGTAIKQIRENYYLYSATSHYSKEKGYPVSEQRYLGKITKEGLIEPMKISFLPGRDKLTLLKERFDLSACALKDREILEDIPVFVLGEHSYTGYLNAKQKAALKLYFDYEEGEIRWINRN